MDDLLELVMDVLLEGAAETAASPKVPAASTDYTDPDSGDWLPWSSWPGLLGGT